MALLRDGLESWASLAEELLIGLIDCLYSLYINNRWLLLISRAHNSPSVLLSRIVGFKRVAATGMSVLKRRPINLYYYYYNIIYSW